MALLRLPSVRASRLATWKASPFASPFPLVRTRAPSCCSAWAVYGSHTTQASTRPAASAA